MSDDPGQMQVVRPLDAEVIRVHVIGVFGEIALERAQRLPALTERRVEDRQRLGETEVGRPFLETFLQDRARLREVARAHQRITEPHVDLREIGSVDERRLPRARRFGIMAGGRERGGEIRQRG
jgi:hypothetical protein